MADVNPTADKPGLKRPRTLMDSVSAQWAGWFGVALTFLALIGFLVIAGVLSNNSLGFAALAGVAIISVSLTALIILSRAVGITDTSAALGLPAGSIRALLALGLAIVFVAVASWTLGGLFDPVGRQVAEVTLPSSEFDALKSRYGEDQYLIVQTQHPASNNAAPVSDFKVYLKRAVDQNLVDFAKQILTIIATVLVTIIGFYFGSNSTADAARSVANAMRSADAVAGVDQSSAAPVNPEQSANAIASIASSTIAKLQALGEDPTDLLRRAIADATDPELRTALSTAQDQLTILTAKANAAATDAGRAKEATAAAAGSDAAAAQGGKDRLAQLMADAMAANQDFEEALARFKAARDTILRKTAKG
jgi:hypothetical protein